MVLGAVLLSMFTVVASPTGAGAQTETCLMTPFYEGTAVIATSAATVTPGQTIEIIGSGWPPNSGMPLTINGVDAGVAVSDASGNFTFSYTVPAGTSGTLIVSASCGEFFLTSTVVVTPVTPTSVPVQQPLVPTGSNSADLFRIALVLIVGGAALMLLTRRRQRAEVAAEAGLAT